MNTFCKIAVSGLILLMCACKQEYPLPQEARDLNLLVVEGLLNSGPGTTIVRLTRTVNPKDTATIKPELRAIVTIQGENNTTFQLTGNNRGEYIANQLNLNSNIKYRLSIKTANGKEYLSDFVPVLRTPAIDSIYWKRNAADIQIFASTHDPQNKTWYYRWEYDETWEINSAFATSFQYVGGSVIPRPDPFAIYYCWRHESSNQILLNSSAKLSQDIIPAQPIKSIIIGTERISVRYSILVRQYALSKEAYQFWEIMKKNTEQVGTLFDPQPSQLNSNIRCVNDPEEAVIGYISAGSFEQKRIFIRRNEVDPWRYYLACDLKVVTLDSFRTYFDTRSHIPVSEYLNPFTGDIAGYHSGTTRCVDCTTVGTLVKPSFW